MKKMWVERIVLCLVIGSCVLSFTSSVDASKDNLPRLPGETLLVGHFPDDLAVTVGDQTTQIEAGGGWEVLPSLSADGRVVASARMVTSRFAETKLTFLVGTYDLVSNQWTEYGGLAIKGGAVSISPDGTKLACSKMAEGDALLHILDLKTGNITVGPEMTKDAGFLTWSPDGRRIAFNKEVEVGTDDGLKSLLPEIYVFTIRDGAVTKIAEGTAPSWSPSGEWIAFSDYSVFRHGKYADTAFRLSIVHPDGTGLVGLLQRSKDLMLPPVWSPDSKGLLIQQPQEDEVNPKVTVSELDLATLKLTGKFKNSPEVYGWAAAKQ